MPSSSSKPKPNVGDELPTWFSGREDGLSTVLAVTPYTGRYPEFFSWVVRFTALNTRRGWMEQAW